MHKLASYEYFFDIRFISLFFCFHLNSGLEVLVFFFDHICCWWFFCVDTRHCCGVICLASIILSVSFSIYISWRSKQSSGYGDNGSSNYTFKWPCRTSIFLKGKGVRSTLASRKHHRKRVFLKIPFIKLSNYYSHPKSQSLIKANWCAEVGGTLGDNSPKNTIGLTCFNHKVVLNKQ